MSPGPTKKCQSCHTLNAVHQPICLSCRHPLTPPIDEPSPRLPRRTATLFAALGLAISVSFIPPNFPYKQRESVKLVRTLTILGISAACAPLGYGVGLLIRRAKLAQSRRSDAAFGDGA